MGVHTDWVDIKNPFFKVSCVTKGTEMPDGQFVTEDFALVIEDSNMVVIEGSVGRLTRFLQSMQLAFERTLGLAEATARNAETLAATADLPIEEAAEVMKAVVEPPSGHWLTHAQREGEYRDQLLEACAVSSELQKVMNRALPLVWTTDGMQQDFQAQSFEAPYVVAVERATGIMGSLQFTNRPRFYFGWQPAT